jgi:uncharacterized protein YndB with AHSA1/START domain
MTKTLTFSKSVNASPQQVYHAFTNAQALQEWFGDLVEADPREDGRFYSWWNIGYFTSGQFKTLEDDKKVVMSWQGLGEPSATTVSVDLAANNGHTDVTLTHDGIGDGETWQMASENFSREWEGALSNLKSVLEDGVDKRLFDRPMLGFFVGGMIDAQQAENLEVPVQTGVHVTGVIDGMGAQQAGLQADDVIHQVNGVELVDFQALSQVLGDKKGGDTIQTVVYRGPEHMVIDVDLSRRPIPDYPGSPDAVAEAMEPYYKAGFKAVKDVFEGVSEAQAMHRPAEGEWNAKEAVAHLLISERWAHINMELSTEGSKGPGYPNHQNLHTAMAETYSAEEMLTELKQSIKLNLELVKHVPQSFQDRKGSYFNAFTNVEFIQTHFEQHAAQAKAAIESFE